MKLRGFLIVKVLMSLTLATALAKPVPLNSLSPAEAGNNLCYVSKPVSNPLPPPPPSLASKDKVLVAAYYNTLAILSGNNRCSDFFGGQPAAAIFNILAGQLRKDYFAASVAMRMQGTTTTGQDAQSIARYRTFSKVSINANGAFYRASRFRSEQTIRGVGSFEPNTDEVRVLILLHELGHLIKGADGNWLLPDDGGNEALSRDNSLKIEKVCGDEIKNLGNGEALRNLALRNQADEKLAAEGEPALADAAGVH